MAIPDAGEQSAPAVAGVAEPLSAPALRDGDPVEFVLDGHEYFGEVVRIDEAAGEADVCIIPAMEFLTVDLSLFQRVPVDDDDARDPSCLLRRPRR